MNVKELDRRAWEIHREWCESAEHDAPCWGPTAEDYAKAKDGQ